jgi:hypothetical protein
VYDIKRESSVTRRTLLPPTTINKSVELSEYDWIQETAASHGFEGHLNSKFSVRFPFNPNTGLLKSLLAVADPMYMQLDLLPDSGLALGLDLLPRNIPLFNDADRRHFTGRNL